MNLTHMWTQIHPNRWESESPGRCSDEDLTLVVYKTRSGRWHWRALDANDYSLVECGYGRSPTDAQRQAEMFAR